MDQNCTANELDFLPHPQKTKKCKKGVSSPLWTERGGGLAVAGGEVRRGKPSQTGDLKHSFRTTPAPRWGTANLNRCARSPYPRGTPASGLPRLDAEPGNIPAEPDRPRQDPGETGKKASQNLCKIWSGRVPGASGIGPGAFRNAPKRRFAPKIQKNK